MSTITSLTTGEAVGESLVILAVFAVGAVCGILAFSKFLHWLLGRFHKETLIVLAGFIIGSLVKVWPWSNIPAIVTSQFPAVAALEQAAEAAAETGIGAEAAQKALDLAIAEHTSMIDPKIGMAVLFALIGFFLVTGIEIAGKVLSKENK